MSQQMYEAMTDSVIDGEVEDATHLAQQALQIGINPLDASRYSEDAISAVNLAKRLLVAA